MSFFITNNHQHVLANRTLLNRQATGTHTSLSGCLESKCAALDTQQKPMLSNGHLMFIILAGLLGEQCPLLAQRRPDKEVLQLLGVI